MQTLIPHKSSTSLKSSYPFVILHDLCTHVWATMKAMRKQTEGEEKKSERVAIFF